MKSFLKAARQLGQRESETTGAPPFYLVQLTVDVGRRLAQEHGADPDIVEAGTLLMDCQLGVALQEGRPQDHVDMSAEKASELLDDFPDIDAATRDTILACVRQHHGSDRFDSREAEVCCNADCYRFASVKGFIGGIRHMRDMPLEEMLKLLDDKADEKWNALTFDTCRKELEPQYKVIKEMIARF